MAKRRARHPQLGDPETGLMSAEELETHRELQYLRAVGISQAHRRRGKRRRIQPVNKNQQELQAWAETRADKLDAVRRGEV